MMQSASGFRPETHVAIDAVQRALELARRGVGAAVTSAKGGRHLVTATDVAVEDAVRGIVSDAVGSLVVGEERGGEAPADGSTYWLLDPICGTRNFASGMPLYCVNLALVEGDQLTVAVVGDPSTDEIHVAERGRGAWALKDCVRRAATNWCRPVDGRWGGLQHDGKRGSEVVPQGRCQQGRQGAGESRPEVQTRRPGS